MTAIGLVTNDGGIVWRCESVICPNVARWTVLWPGQTTKKCNGCTAWARKVAAAMGFDLVATELDAPPLDGDPASRRFALMELM